MKTCWDETTLKSNKNWQNCDMHPNQPKPFIFGRAAGSSSFESAVPPNLPAEYSRSFKSLQHSNNNFLVAFAYEAMNHLHSILILQNHILWYTFKTKIFGRVISAAASRRVNSTTPTGKMVRGRRVGRGPPQLETCTKWLTIEVNGYQQI